MLSPADRCPFADRLDSCAVSEVELFLPLTSQGQPLAPARTCRHLTTGVVEAGRFYARCALGDAATRARLAAEGVPEAEPQGRLRPAAG